MNSVKNAWIEGGAGISAIDELKDNYSSIFTSSEYWDKVEADLLDSVSQDVSGIARTASSAINDVMNNDVIGYITDPIGMVSDIMTSTMSQVSSGIQAAISSVSESVNEILDTLDSLYGPKMWKAFLSDSIKHKEDLVTDQIDSRTQELLDKWLNRKLIYHTKNSEGFWNYFDRTLDNEDNCETRLLTSFEEDDRTGKDTNETFGNNSFTTVDFKSMSREKFKVLYESDNENSKITNNLMISNDLFWNIDITPYTHNGNTPPSLRGIYQVDSNGYLPIVSYSFSGDEMKMTNFAVEGNVNFSIPLPSGVSKPSRVSITMPELVYRDGDTAYACSQQFKKEFLKYLYQDENLTVRDFRECAYEITLTKFSPQWRKVGIWHLIGIPDISVSEQGSSSSSAEFIELSFSIVGEKDLTDDEQAKLTVETDKKSTEQITVVKSS